MSQSIVPVEIPQYCRFDSKKRNGILFNVCIANLKFIFYIILPAKQNMV
ncbi:TPA: galactose-6-phosphate isomerase [Streptococcus pneumoniae]|nr:galactose-6-phosphate isomerase [Streptococcus pneumoniae]